MVSPAQANKNELGKVFARKGARKNQVIMPNAREWMTILTTINVVGEYLPNFYIFKNTRATRKYVSKWEEGTIWAMQKKNGWMLTYYHSRWINSLTCWKQRKCSALQEDI